MGMQIMGEGEESFSFLCHLGCGLYLDLWESNPFQATERNDAIYGRVLSEQGLQCRSFTPLKRS